jgi:type IV pilus assembly protein PilW
MKNKQIGFTLIELMISLALGLIVVAAAILLFLTGQKSVAMQKGVGELQDNANFGLNYITKDIRLTNLNVKSATINDQTPYGGIVLSSSSTELNSNVHLTTAALDASLISKDNLTSNVTDSGGSTVTSDQLVIQYLPQYTLDDKGTSSTADDDLVGGFDCEGNELRFNKATIGLQMVVQRYFLRADNNKASNEGSPLALACDAGHYSLSTPDSIQGYGGSGEIIMKRVDHFRVLLGVQYANGTHRYLPIASYMALTAPRPRILSIQLGALARSTQSMGGDALIKADQTFQVLDQTVKLKAMTDPKYIRQVVSQTIALRNALGERE